jgi:hypothetical protein
MLLNFGIASRIYAERHRARVVEFGGRSYDCRADHDLVIGRDNVSRFAAEIGFLGGTKRARILRHPGAVPGDVYGARRGGRAGGRRAGL